PLAMTEVQSGRRMPEGMRWKAYFLSSPEGWRILTVWPALEPPFQRMAKSKCSVRRSTILPLPSSPHWRPTMEVLPRERSAEVSGEAGAERGSDKAVGIVGFPKAEFFQWSVLVAGRGCKGGGAMWI